MKTVSTPKITKRPRTPSVKTESPQDVAIESFIDSAPDSSTKTKTGVTEVETPKQTSSSVKKKRSSVRIQISHTVPPALLEKIDAKAETMGLTRSGLINYVLSDFVNK